jgi:hypothetical protein
MNRINQFYSTSLGDDTAVLTPAALKELLEQQPSFDWTEFNKPIHEVDMRKVAESVDVSLGGRWKCK